MNDITGKEYIYGLAQDKNGAPYLFNIGELVRCKDCRHFSYYETVGADGRKMYGNYCGRLSSMWVFVDEDDFCSYGERREP